jgi:hypothetical protein
MASSVEAGTWKAVRLALTVKADTRWRAVMEVALNVEVDSISGSGGGLSVKCNSRRIAAMASLSTQ